MKKFDNKKPYLIAEIGVNHNGSMEIAKKLIKHAKINNFDAVKFQTYLPSIYTHKTKKILFTTSNCSNIYKPINYLLQILSYFLKVESFQTPRIIWLIRLI